jgi:hypothetical protein
MAITSSLRTCGTDGTKKAAFLDALSRLASISQACQFARIPRRTVYNWRNQNKGFATAWEKAIELGTDTLEDEAVRRALQGVLKPVYQQGRRVGSIREFSDALLIALLKARRPKKYRDNLKVEASVTGGVLLMPTPATKEDWAQRYGPKSEAGK